MHIPKSSKARAHSKIIHPNHVVRSPITSHPTCYSGPEGTLERGEVRELPGSELEIEAAKEDICDPDGADEEAFMAALNTEGERKSMVNSFTTRFLPVLTPLLPQEWAMRRPIYSCILEPCQALRNADGGFARKVQSCGRLDFNPDMSYAQPLDVDVPVASSSKLPNAPPSPPNTESMELDRSWLSRESRVHNDVFREIAPPLPSNTESMELDRSWLSESQVHAEVFREMVRQRDAMAMREEDVDTVVDKDTYLVQDNGSTLTDPFVAKDQEYLVSPVSSISHSFFY